MPKQILASRTIVLKDKRHLLGSKHHQSNNAHRQDVLDLPLTESKDVYAAFFKVPVTTESIHPTTPIIAVHIHRCPDLPVVLLRE
jgi:hypothetical protein